MGRVQGAALECAEEAHQPAGASARRLHVRRRRARQELPDGPASSTRCRCGARRGCTSTSSCARCTASWRELQGTVNPLDELGLRISKRYKLICFDEFHVADITDAMILHRLLVALFENGVGFVTTSNFKPDDLYPGGLHRDRILPAIALLNEKLEVLSVDNGTDYRRRTLEQVRLYLTPNGAEADQEMRQGLRQAGRERRRRPGAAHRGARDPGPAQGGRRGLVRLQDAVRRPAFAERLPRNREPVPHGAAVRRAADDGGAWLRKHAVSPGWSTCSTTAGSSSSCRRRCRPRRCTPRARWPTSSRARSVPR